MAFSTTTRWGHNIMKILLAVDGSPYTKKMLAYLVTHSETFGGSNSFTLSSSLRM